MAALDPFTSPTDASTANSKVGALTLEARRLEALTGLVAEVVKAAEKKEAKDACAKAYSAAKRECDTLTTWARERYPEIVAELTAYAARLRANNRALDAVNSALPEGRERLAYAETTARGWNPAQVYDRAIIDMKLPHGTDVKALAWPPAPVNFAAELMKAAG